MIQIAIIRKNMCLFSNIEEYMRPLLYKIMSDSERKSIKKKIDDYIWSVMEPNIEFISVEQENIPEKMCTTIAESFKETDPDVVYDNLMFHTEPSYTSAKAFLEVVYANYGTEIQTPEQEEPIINNIGCLFSLEHKVIKNTCVILANRYSETAEKYVELTDVTKRDILRVIRRRFVHSALIIEQYRTVKIYYQDPIMLISKYFDIDEDQQISRISVSLFGYNLTLYFNNEPDEYLNELATRFNGNYSIRGNVIIIHELEDKIYANINNKELERLNQISFCKIQDREIKREKDKLPLWSKYLIVNHFLRQGHKCGHCNKDVGSDGITCNVCHRVRYCSLHCMRENQSVHPPECLYR